MKFIIYATSVISSFFSLYSMETVPFVAKESKIPLIHHVIKLLPKRKPQKLIATYLMRLSQEVDLLDALQQKIHVAAQYMGQHSQEIKTYKNIARGGAAGACAGVVGGITGLSGYGMVDGCMWCWCNANLAKITCCMTLWGLLGCGCVGCVTGSCCVATGCAQKMECGS
jgi:hypothetical protein